MKKVYSNSGILIGEYDIAPRANLQRAYLYNANLRGANLSDANLQDVNLQDANLFGANLRGANLQDANLRFADLRRANLSDANLRNADFSGTVLEDTKLPKFQIPQRKSLIVFKKLQNDKIAKLRIPCRAKRTASLVGNKCRAERAIVLEIYDMTNPGTKYQTGRSIRDPSFIYKVGKEVKPDKYSGDIRQQCLPGIHFFMTEKEARRYAQ